MAETGAEDAAQGGLRNEEVGVLHGDEAAVIGDAGTRHDAVDVRVKIQFLIPRVEDHGEAARRGSQPARVGEGVAKRGGCGGEEELIDVFCLRGEEQGAEFLR